MSHKLDLFSGFLFSEEKETLSNEQLTLHQQFNIFYYLLIETK